MLTSRSRPRRHAALLFRILESLESRVLLSGNTYSESLYSFTGGTDGAGPFGGLVADSQGNLFGTTVSGANGNRGSVYKLPADTGNLTVLHDFTGNGDGANPYGTLAIDSFGNIFGTTFSGGAFNKGTVFEIPDDGSFNTVILHSFNGTDGINPYAGVVVDSSGNIFGTATAGGAFGHGTVFKISSGGVFSVLHSFNGTVDGSTPFGPLTLHGTELWGTTFEGGANDFGTLFKITSNTFTTVHVFNGLDGSGPTGKLAFDGGGNLFGTTSTGGDDDEGTLFGVLASSSTLSTLYSFTGGNDGSRPFSGLTFDTNGNLFGTNYSGGAFGSGTVFEVPFDGITPLTLHAFTGGVDGATPYGGILVSPAGNLFGTSTGGGARGRGTLFKFSPIAATDHLFIDTQPTTVKAGSKPTFVIDLKKSNDANSTADNSQVAISIVSGPAGAVLGGISTVDAHNGVATFTSLQLNRAGTYTLQATAGSLDPVVLDTIVVNPGAASRVAFVQQPTTFAAGATITPAVTVAIEDSLGNIITTSNSMISLQLASGPATAVLTGTLAVAATNGVATFNDLSLIKAGTYTLSAASGNFPVIKSSSFIVTPDTATAHFAITQQPGNAIVGRKIAPGLAVTLQDQFGNIIASSTTQVTANLVVINLGGNATAAQLTGTTTLKLSHGTANFSNLIISQPGDYQLQISGGGFSSANSNTIHSVFLPTHLAFTQQPLQTVAGNTFTSAIVVSILDAANRVDTTNNSLVTLSLKGNGTLNGTVTVAAINGVATFPGLSIDQAGTFTLSAATGTLTAGKSASFKITPDLSTAHLALTQLPAGSIVVGKTLAPGLVATVVDQFNNRITTDHSPVTLSILAGPTNGTLLGTTTVNTSAGIATFKNIVLPVAGSYSLQLADATLIDPTPAAFSQVITQGVTTITGVPSSLTRIFGQTVTLSPTFKSTAPTSIPFTGIATLEDTSHNVLGTVSLTASGAAKFNITNLAPGTYLSHLVYPGDVNHTSFTSSTFTLQVNLSKTTATLTTSSSTLVFGQPLTLTAAVKTTTAPGTPRTGNIIFYDGLTPLGTIALDGSSMASLTLTPSTLGKHSYKAVYQGDSNFLTSTSSAATRTVALDKTLTTVTPSLTSPIAHNQTFNLDIHVAVLAPGATTLTGDLVIIKDNGKPLTTLNLDSSGNATLAGLTYTSSGKHTLTVIYAGDTESLSSTSPALKLTIT